MALKLKYVAVTVALFLAVSFCLEQRAYAYVDPGSSLLIFQSISAMITGALFYFRKRLKSLSVSPRPQLRLTCLISSVPWSSPALFLFSPHFAIRQAV